MRDRELRESLLRLLRGCHREPDTLFVDELALGGLVRVDVAAVNGALWGYEIKSARDTLRRLPLQIEVYSRVLDYAALVVAGCHYDRAVDLLPDWWCVYVATESAAGIELALERRGEVNNGVDPSQLVQLLWRDEALAELAERGLDRGVRSQPRRALWQRLVENVELPQLQLAVRTRLKTRVGWRADR
jgi:hypothetical protein